MLKFLESKLHLKWLQWLLLLIISFIWGSSFILMKRGLQGFSSEQVAAFRIFAAGIFLLPIALNQLKGVKNRRDWYYLGISGLLGNLIPAFLFTTSQRVLSSSFAGMLNALTPLFALVVGLSMFGLKFSKINITGVIVGLIGGVGLIAANSGFSISSDQLSYALLPVLATLFYGINVNILKSYLGHLTALQISGVSFLLLIPFSAVLLVFSGFFDVISSGSSYTESLNAILILAFFGTAVALVMFNTLLKFTSALFASAVTYLMPVFAIMWGVLDGEPFMPSFLFWIALILAGVFMVNTRR